MAKDKLIKARASDYDKAVLKALTVEFNSKESLPVTLNESDMVRYCIDQIAKKYLTADQFKDLKSRFDKQN